MIPKKHCAILIRKVPITLRDMFKGHCHSRGENMTDVLLEFMKLRVKGHQMSIKPIPRNV